MSKHDKGTLDDLQAQAQASVDAWKTMWLQSLGGLSSEPMQAAGERVNETSTAQFERTLEGLKSYCQWLESISAASASAPTGMPWHDALGKAFGGHAEQPFAQAFADFPGIQTVASAPWAQPFSDAAKAMQSPLHEWLKAPAFGVSREQQEQAQALGRAWLDYVEQTARYKGLIARAGAMAAEHLQDLLAARDEPGRQVDSLRALYDLWIDSAEEAYAEVAMSGEFRNVYAAMVNAQMQLRKLLQEQVEHGNSQLGMPTRSEVNSLGERVQTLRRQLKKASAESEALGTQVADLRKEVAGLRKAHQPPARTARATPRKAASKSAKSAASKRKPVAKSAARKPAAKGAAERPRAKSAGPKRKRAARKTVATKAAKSATKKTAGKGAKKTANRAAAARRKH